MVKWSICIDAASRPVQAEATIFIAWYDVVKDLCMFTNIPIYCCYFPCRNKIKRIGSSRRTLQISDVVADLVELNG